jgi:hypothetical protein
MAGEESNIGKELRQMPVEPLLPVEKKLIRWSLALAPCCSLFSFGRPRHCFREAATGASFGYGTLAA